MESEGWIKLHRKFLEWEWIDSSEMVKLFIYLLLEANHEDKRWQGIVIKRGQFLTSLDRIAESNHYSIQKVRTCLSRLESTGEISKITTNRYTVITISNYERYQLNESDVQQTNNKQITSEQQTNNNQTTTTKNDKNDKNIYTTQTIEGKPTENFGGWRYLSSVQRSYCKFDKDKMAEMKRDIFRKEVEPIAQRIGMPLDQVDDFVRYYTEHTPGDDKIRAESYDHFNIGDRMISWMKRERPKSGGTRMTQQPKDKFQTIIEERNKFQQALYGIIDNIPADSSPDFQSGE